jgi:hypothetical protein
MALTITSIRDTAQPARSPGRAAARRILATASILLTGSLLTATPLSAQTAGEVFRVSLEEPVQGQSHSGVGNLRGWAIATDGIEKISVYVDGVYAFDAPYGGERTDVGSAFPDVAGSAQSGFSLAYNYSELDAGTHTIRATAQTTSGATLSSEATFTVLRFESSFISDPQQVDISSAQCVINGQQITLIDALIEGRATDITLQWRTATQGFELLDVR